MIIYDPKDEKDAKLLAACDTDEDDEHSWKVAEKYQK